MIAERLARGAKRGTNFGSWVRVKNGVPWASAGSSAYALSEFHESSQHSSQGPWVAASAVNYWWLFEATGIAVHMQSSCCMGAANGNGSAARRACGTSG